jgi:hypothetical protein
VEERENFQHVSKQVCERTTEAERLVNECVKHRLSSEYIVCRLIDILIITSQLIKLRPNGVSYPNIFRTSEMFILIEFSNQRNHLTSANSKNVY